MTIKTLLIAIPLMLTAWFATLLVVALLTDDAPAYVVLFPGIGFMANLPSDVAVISASDISVTLASDKVGFAKSLYQQGAWIVLPAGLAGCLPMPVA